MIDWEMPVCFTTKFSPFNFIQSVLSLKFLVTWLRSVYILLTDLLGRTFIRPDVHILCHWHQIKKSATFLLMGFTVNKTDRKFSFRSHSNDLGIYIFFFQVFFFTWCFLLIALHIDHFYLFFFFFTISRMKTFSVTISYSMYLHTYSM